jgi:hypothetical protein
MTLRPHALQLLAALAIASPASAQVPAALTAPGDVALFTLGATGVQAYECRAGEGGALAWAFKEPRAMLLRGSETVGSHGAGPFWQMADGSRVVGRVTARADAMRATDIPWLRLEVAQRSGAGVLDPVTHIQRINTVGGTLAGACPTAGAVSEVPYTSDYVMLRNP